MHPVDPQAVVRPSCLIPLGFVLVLGFILVASAAVGLIYWVERTTLRNWARKTERFVPKGPHRFETYSPGLETPPALKAGEATLADDENVIGIEAGGQARAYHLRSLMGTKDHIVNDLLGGRAVTVTYCDLADCARAFDGGSRPTPLDVAQGGLLDGLMVVKVGPVSYLQETGAVVGQQPGHPPVPFPYEAFPLTRTTWGQWKASHPETDVYVKTAKAPDPGASASANGP